MGNEFQVSGTNKAALFTLKLHRGDGMVLLAMNWKNGEPPDDFVGFAIEYMEPEGDRFFAVTNRISFPGVDLKKDKGSASSIKSPIQKFRWVHFPFHPDIPGDFTYKVKPVFMDENDMLSYGEPQQAAIKLQRDTYPGLLNVAFTRGFISSQKFVETYMVDGSLDTLLPQNADDGLNFKPTHPNAKEALEWMGFEARNAILGVLDEAIADPTAKVRLIAYDFNEPEVLSRLKKLKKRVRVIIDNSKDHSKPGAAENEAERQLKLSAGAENVRRQKMRNIQHNKMIVVDGDNVKKVACGSTNFSWRGFFVQNNNVVVLTGEKPVKIFWSAFEQFWPGDADAFDTSTSADWNLLGLNGINSRVSFSPHSDSNAKLQSIADDVEKNCSSSLFYSLAFLAQTTGSIRDSITKITLNDDIFVFGMADRKVGGFDLLMPDGNVAPVYPSFLSKNLPSPFSAEPSGLSGSKGTRMHHKFVVIDFDKPTARVYLGSYNFSNPADLKNGENLLLIRDRRVAVSYMVEALRIFDHYRFRVILAESKKAKKSITLHKPPRVAGEATWWKKDYTEKRRIRDRELFS